jgi:hypothetical protein
MECMPTHAGPQHACVCKLWARMRPCAHAHGGPPVTRTPPSHRGRTARAAGAVRTHARCFECAHTSDSWRLVLSTVGAATTKSRNACTGPTHAYNMYNVLSISYSMYNVHII